jgi:REP element-mobilizing transposase RayT
MGRKRQTEMKFKTWGGNRKNAGRKPAGAKAGVPHRKRPRVTRHTPVHVTCRIRRDIGKLRNGRNWRVIERAIYHVCHREGFAVVEFSVQSNHVHLIVGAHSSNALARGMQALNARIARGINYMLGRTGGVFADRYSVRALKNPTQANHALCYVLNSFRRHAAESGERIWTGWIDPCSSGPYFDGWTGVREPPENFAFGLPVTVEASSWLLTEGWRKRGLIHVDAVPGPAKAA